MPFHVTVRNALSDDTHALDALLSLVPENRRALHALSLPPPRFLRDTSSVLLVGRILPGADGSLVVSHTRKHYCHIVIAPLLSSDARASLVYCSDFRVVRCQNNRAVLEVLSAHVHILARCDYYSKPPPNLRSLSLTEAAAHPRRINGTACVVAAVVAKSPIFGSSDTCFIVELGDVIDVQERAGQPAVAAVLFSGHNSLKWWPFIHPGRKLAFVALKRALLPSYGERHIFKVSDDTTLIYSELTSTSSISGTSVKKLPSPQSAITNSRSRPKCRKRLRCSPSGTSKKISSHVVAISPPPFHCSQHTITYQGVITECLSDGRIRLDDSVYLHLGGDYSWLSNGPRSSTCVRTGARIEACNVSIGFQRGVATTLFPTGRTTIYFLYFGNLSNSITPPIREWHKSPWFRYWTLLSTSYSLWCQELYDTLALKFQLWFAPAQNNAVNQSQLNDSLVVDQLLGSSAEPGLLEFLMEKVSGEVNLFEKRRISTQFYDEFFGSQTTKPGDENDSKKENSFPYMPTFSELTLAVDVKWLSSPSAAASGQQDVVGYSKSSKGRVFVETFTSIDLAETIPVRSRRDAQRAPAKFGTSRNEKVQQIKDITLVGVIEGCRTDDATLLLHDATGAVYCECDQVLDPALIGAVVIIQDFCVVVESFSWTSERDTTFLFRLDSVQVLVDGPAAAYDDESISRPLSQTGFRKCDGSSLRISQSFDNSDNELLENFPLVFVFVEQVSSITQHSDGNPLFRISGRLLGAAKNRDAAEWMVLSGNNAQFWNCFFVIHGESAVKIRASLDEGQAYGISCSDFKDCSNIPKLCEDRAIRSRTTPHSVALYSSSANGLWLQKLDDEDFEKFKPFTDSLNSIDVGDGEDGNRFGIDYQCWKPRRVLDLLSPYWKPSTELQNGLVSFNALFLRVCALGETDIFRESECAWSPAYFSILLIEKETTLFRIEVVFLGTSRKPRGLIPGSEICVLNVKRRLSNDGRLLFTACEMTRIRTVKFNETKDAVSSAVCCSRVGKNAGDLVAKFGSSFLWNFCAAVGLGSAKKDFRMCALVRLSILELKHIKFSYSSGVSGCDYCAGLDGTRRCIEARAVVTVDDGTSRGDLECSTFRTVMELLGASEEERNEFRRSLPSCELVMSRDNGRASGWMGSESDSALKRLIRKSSLQRTTNVLVRNLVGNGHTSSISLLIDEADSRGHNLGYGRKLWTAEAPSLHSAKLEGLMFWAEDDWVQEPGRALADTAACLSIIERFESHLVK